MRERPFGTRAGISLNLADADGSGPPIILLHGVTRRWQEWMALISSFAPFGRVLAPDLRGHGRSDRAAGAYRVADYVPDIVDLLHAQDEPVILIGHSLGGNLAVAAAAEAPDRVRAVVLEDPPLGMAGPRLDETGFRDLFLVFREHAGSDRPVHEIASTLAEARVPASGRGGLARLGDLRDATTLRASAAGLKRLDAEVLRPPIEGRWLDGSEVESQLRRIACPTLLLQADFDCGGILPDDHAAAMVASLRDGVHIKLPGVGHSIHANAAGTMLRHVAYFLGSLD